MANGFLTCSFCAKTQREVAYLIVGPMVYICDECVGLCIEILADRGHSDSVVDTGIIYEVDDISRGAT